MSRIVVMNQMSLDGVIQGLAGPDADTRGGFTHSGWGARAAGGADGAALGAKMGERMAAGGGLSGWLLGRRTYEELLTAWNARGGPFKDALNATRKYVASRTRTRTDPLTWPNSTLLRGEATESVRALKAETDGVLGIMGSGELVGALAAARLVDEYLLMIHPLVLGSGRRLFPEGVDVPLRLLESSSTPGGIVVSTYEPAYDVSEPTAAAPSASRPAP